MKKRPENTFKVLQAGLGPLGVKIAQFIDRRPAFETVAAVDPAPHLAGLDFTAHTGVNPPSKKQSLSIASSVSEALLSSSQPDVAILATVSDLERIAPQIQGIVEAGIPVVSTCEELCFPIDPKSPFRRQIDEAAQANGVAVLGTGVNPGFLMDTLPLSLTALCQNVESIEVKRIQDAAQRRLPFQIKIGAGLTPQEFDAQAESGQLRHVGLRESVSMIASRMRWNLDRVEESIEAVIAGKDITIGEQHIKKGEATGVCQTGVGVAGGQSRIRLVFRAAVCEPETYDEIRIAGEPPLTSRIDGGVNGDVATCAIVLNSIPQLLRASPGLKTMVDIPPVSYFD